MDIHALGRKICRDYVDYDGIDVQYDAILTGTAHQEVTNARYVIFYVIYQIKHISGTDLAHEFGRKSHSCVNRGLNIIKRKMENDPRFKNFIDQTIKKYS